MGNTVINKSVINCFSVYYLYRKSAMLAKKISSRCKKSLFIRRVKCWSSWVRNPCVQRFLRKMEHYLDSFQLDFFLQCQFKTSKNIPDFSWFFLINISLVVGRLKKHDHIATIIWLIQMYEYEYRKTHAHSFSHFMKPEISTTSNLTHNF